MSLNKNCVAEVLEFYRPIVREAVEKVMGPVRPPGLMFEIFGSPFWCVPFDYVRASNAINPNGQKRKTMRALEILKDRNSCMEYFRLFQAQDFDPKTIEFTMKGDHTFKLAALCQNALGTPFTAHHSIIGDAAILLSVLFERDESITALKEQQYAYKPEKQDHVIGPGFEPASTPQTSFTEKERSWQTFRTMTYFGVLFVSEIMKETTGALKKLDCLSY